MNTVAGVKALLRDIHRIEARQYLKGDYAAVDIMIDLQRAAVASRLTARQWDAISLVYIQDMRQIDAAEIIGIARNTLSEIVHRACERIADVFDRWGYGEITVPMELAEEIDEENEEESDAI